MDDFWQQQQLEEQEQSELQESIDWWMARRDQFNESNEESENEHRYFGVGQLRDGQEH